MHNKCNFNVLRLKDFNKFCFSIFVQRRLVNWTLHLASVVSQANFHPSSRVKVQVSVSRKVWENLPWKVSHSEFSGSSYNFQENKCLAQSTGFWECYSWPWCRKQCSLHVQVLWKGQTMTLGRVISGLNRLMSAPLVTKFRTTQNDDFCDGILSGPLHEPAKTKSNWVDLRLKAVPDPIFIVGYPNFKAGLFWKHFWVD